jgi:hypothetical protein
MHNRLALVMNIEMNTIGLLYLKIGMNTKGLLLQQK